MQKIKTQPSLSQLHSSSLSKGKKLVLMKIFKRQNINTEHNYHERESEKYKSLNHNDNFQHKARISKTQRFSINLNNKQNIINNQSTNRYISENENNNNVPLESNRKINIFSSQYLNCLKKGFINPYEQSNKIVHKKVENNDFQGPVYKSQSRLIQQTNPQHQKQEYQQVYKFDRNRKFMKFKVSLKRYSMQVNKTQIEEKPILKKISNKILITRLKTEESNPSLSDINSQRNTCMRNQKRFSSLRNENYSQQGYKKQKQGFPFNIPRLRQKSNLFQSIKIFQRKQNLLGQIQHSKGKHTKYGTKFFEHILRDRFKQQQRKYEFQNKIQYECDQPKKTMRNQFIKNIQQGKYEVNFKYKKKQKPLKLKGISKVACLTEKVTQQ